MATLGEERTDVLGESGICAAGRGGVARSPVFDDLLVHRPNRVGVRAMVVLLVAVFASLSVWASGGGAFGAQDDCYLISGSEYGGVTVVPGCGAVGTAPVPAVALQPAANATDAVPQATIAPSQLWVPVPRLIVSLVAGLLE